ncbi:hypothetical protein [Raoultibacter phocaeensis]|uniref:hypothetical protein n=1 Tax=Raoultibacter phocaeensis TaxID=2479841 RepID=UPI00111B2C5B|nr:hypothetical protein [Raoultibacter phocaeensis]
MDTAGTLDEIYPISALIKKQKEVKEAAQRGVVRITEQGAGAYVFSSEEQYEKAIRRAQEEAVYEARLRDTIIAGRADMNAGRVHSDHEDFFAAIREGLA